MGTRGGGLGRGDILVSVRGEKKPKKKKKKGETGKKPKKDFIRKRTRFLPGKKKKQPEEEGKKEKKILPSPSSEKEGPNKGRGEI